MCLEIISQCVLDSDLLHLLDDGLHLLPRTRQLIVLLNQRNNGLGVLDAMHVHVHLMLDFAHELRGFDLQRVNINAELLCVLVLADRRQGTADNVAEIGECVNELYQICCEGDVRRLIANYVITLN